MTQYGSAVLQIRGGLPILTFPEDATPADIDGWRRFIRGAPGGVALAYNNRQGVEMTKLPSAERQMIETVLDNLVNGATKNELEVGQSKVSGYWVGDMIRIDIKGVVRQGAGSEPITEEAPHEGQAI